MAVKEYGTGVSGYLDPEGRNWETVVYQAGKPVIDTEQNLIQDSIQNQARKNGPPSGWLMPEVLDRLDQSVVISSATANELELDPLDAYVNGWRIRVTDTTTTGSNVLDLGAGPTGAGGKRFDLVVLEVWRRVLIAAPSPNGKSPAGYIWRFGNVKATDQDATLNHVDDIQDPNVAAPTTKRVQIQYRLRVIQDVDLWSYPWGVGDPAVPAQTVPPDPSTPDGNATAFTYTNQSVVGDPGLWRAGDGNPANGLGTVDGYIYALPLMAVARRNDAAFDRISNHNGGVPTPGPSDRPDGLLNDIIDPRDVIDLRTAVSHQGWSYHELLQKNFHWLLDNALRGEVGETLLGGGAQGANLLTAVEIGLSNANGGAPPATGDTAGADFIAEFDGVRRTFSDQPIVETVWLRYGPSDFGYGATWPATDFTITVTPTTNFIPEGHSLFNWAAHVPPTTSVLSVESVLTDGLNPPPTMMISGVGTVPQANLSLRFPNGITSGGTHDLMLKVVVAYPAGIGMVVHPSRLFGSDGFIWNNPGSLPADYEGDEVKDIDIPHRGVRYEYRTVTLTKTYNVLGNPSGYYEDFDSARDVPLFDRIESVSSVTIDAAPYVGSIEIRNSNQTIRLDPASVGLGQTVVTQFKAIRPMQQVGAQLTVFYETVPMQTVREALSGTSLKLTPRYVSPELYVLVAGTSSLGEGYPFPSQATQSGGVYPTSGGSPVGDHHLRAGPRFATQSFDADTGFGKVLATVPMVANPEELEIQRDPGDRDGEGRVFYKTVPAGYLPSAFGPSLSDPVAHKVLLPILAELPEDGPFGYKGQLVLVTLQRWAPSSSDNAVAFDLDLASNWTAASVYRLKGNPLNGRVV